MFLNHKVELIEALPYFLNLCTPKHVIVTQRGEHKCHSIWFQKYCVKGMRYMVKQGYFKVIHSNVKVNMRSDNFTENTFSHASICTSWIDGLNEMQANSLVTVVAVFVLVLTL